MCHVYALHPGLDAFLNLDISTIDRPQKLLLYFKVLPAIFLQKIRRLCPAYFFAWAVPDKKRPVFYKFWRILTTFFRPKTANLAFAKPIAASKTEYSARLQLQYSRIVKQCSRIENTFGGIFWNFADDLNIAFAVKIGTMGFGLWKSNPNIEHHARKSEKRKA